MRMLSKEYEEFRLAVEQGGKTVMDRYGASGQAEFFAVATECFFEKPKQLCETPRSLCSAKAILQAGPYGVGYRRRKGHQPNAGANGCRR